MNWESFFAAMTWVITIGSGVFTLFAGVNAFVVHEVDDKHVSPLYYVILGIAAITLTLSIALINGMGW